MPENVTGNSFCRGDCAKSARGGQMSEVCGLGTLKCASLMLYRMISMILDLVIERNLRSRLPGVACPPDESFSTLLKLDRSTATASRA